MTAVRFFRLSGKQPTQRSQLLSNMRGMDEFETRTVMSMRTGTKICVLIGLAFVVLAVYFFMVPITSVRTTTGAVFGCGSAMSPAHGGFADGVCGRLADVNTDRAIASLAIGLLTAVAGGAMFGVDRREERRLINRESRSVDHDSFDDDRLDDDRDERRSRRQTDDRLDH